MTGACILPYAPPCASDADCERGTCTRHGECAAELLEVQLRWTVRGQPAGEPACDGIHALQVIFEDRDPPPDLAHELSYQPVPCTLGQISFDRLSARFDSVTVSAHDRDGARLDRVSLPLQPPEVRFEIALLAESALVNCRTCAPGLFSAAHEPRCATPRSGR